jgi:hypothetical protein
MTSIRSYLNKLFQKHNTITVVSGLPRSGTSMMMSALRAGGLPLLTDNARSADKNNPKGYYEFERVKKLQKGDVQWLPRACGKAVKIISALLEYLPETHHYRVIFMERDMDEILASQGRMLERDGNENQHPITDDEMRQSYENHLAEVKAWMGDKDWIQTLFVSYNEALQHPLLVFKRVSAFLDHHVDPEEMTRVVDQDLYRERS